MTLGKLALAAAALACVAATPAAAALIQTSGISGATLPLMFTDALGTTYTPPTPATYAAGPAQGLLASFSGPNTLQREQVNNGYLDSNYADGTQLLLSCGFTSFSCVMPGNVLVAFNAGVTAFEFDVDDFDTLQPYTVSAQAFNDSTSLGTVSVSVRADNAVAPGILAATSTIPITTIVLSSVPTAGGAGDGDFAIGNVSFVGLPGSTAVPEPASLALLGAGLTGLTLVRRRRH